jgi:phage FluMu protein gp41
MLSKSADFASATLRMFIERIILTTEMEKERISIRQGWKTAIANIDLLGLEELQR